jgi:pyruvate kinase
MLSTFNFYKMMNLKNLKKTKIVATIGPETESKEQLIRLMKAGMNIARLNFSHGDFAEHGARVKNIKEIERETGMSIAILQDLGGVKIRIGDFENDAIVLKRGQEFILNTKKVIGNESEVYVNYKKLAQEIEIGQVILLDDGTKELKVVAIKNNKIITKVVNGGMIRSRRGVNIPNARLSVEALTVKDKNDLEFGVKYDVDFVAISFVRQAKDILQLRKILNKKKSKAKIVAKIETPEAIENIDEIISATDVVMVARGDLAVEVPAQEVPHLQRMIINKCQIKGRPVIVATQMMESMIKNPVPTRAEVADVANAILNGTDAVMLSAETTVGNFPVEAVKMMSEIAKRTEREIKYQVVKDNEKYTKNTVNAVSRSVIRTALDIKAKCIVTLSESGETARKIARYRPAQAIVALTPEEKTRKQLEISYGCYAESIKGFKTVSETVVETKKILLDKKIVKKGDRIVIVPGIRFCKSGTTNMMIVEMV